jgi:hypothetical protein
LGDGFSSRTSPALSLIQHRELWNGQLIFYGLRVAVGVGVAVESIAEGVAEGASEGFVF